MNILKKNKYRHFLQIMLFTVICGLSVTSLAAGNVSGNSFNTSKKLLLNQVYSGHMRTFYSNCMFDSNKDIDVNSCGLLPRKQVKRSARLEWEHVVPAYIFGHTLPCWRAVTKYSIRSNKMIRYSSRKNCGMTSPLFRSMESDMHNLRPASGELNADRSNYEYGIIPGEVRTYGSIIDFEVDSKNRLAEPRLEIRGDIARTYFYMAKTYNIHISHKQKEMFANWANADLPDAWEIKRNTIISNIQGNPNSFIKICNCVIVIK